MLWDLALKNLWRRKLRTLLTILGVATAVQLFLLIHGVMVTYDRETQRQLGSFAGKVFITQKLEESRGNSDLTASGSNLTYRLAEELLASEGIDRTASSALIFSPISRATLPYLPPAVLAIGIEPGHETAYLTGLEAESGVLELSNPEDVILGQNALEFYKKEMKVTFLGLGHPIDIGEKTLTIVGILKAAPQIVGNEVVMPLRTAQEIFERKNTVSAVILTADRVDGVNSLKESILSTTKNLTVSTQEDLTQNIRTLLDSMGMFMGVIENSIIVVGILVVTVVVVVAVMEQRREIGTLRAIGAQRWRIFGMVAGEALILSLAGAILALPIALFFVRWGMSSYNTLQGMLQIWGQTILTAVAVGLLASLLPAWQALRVDPMEALRYE